MTLTRKTFEQTCLIEIRRGDRVEEFGNRGRIGKVVDFRLVPNGVNDSRIVCILVIDLKDGSRVVSTSNHWHPIKDEYYLECHTSYLMDIGREGDPAQKADGKKPIEIDNPISLLEV